MTEMKTKMKVKMKMKMKTKTKMKMKKKRMKLEQMRMMKLEKTKMASMKKTVETSKKKISLYIPGDIVSEILLRLPARSLGKFRCVSKSWLSITSGTVFVRANAQLSRITRHSVIVEDLTRPTEVWLDIRDQPNSDLSAIDLREYQQPTKSIPEHSYGIASCDGLVCLVYFTYSGIIQYFVINPLTGGSFLLPADVRKDNDVLIFNLGFYFHHSTSKYRLIRIRNINSMDTTEVLVVGERSWRRIPDNLPAFFHRPNPLDLNGNLYWLASSQKTNPCKDSVVIFDQEQEVFSVVSLPPSLEKLHELGCYLIDFNGELGISAVYMDDTIEVWIMEENFWIKRYSVNHAHIHRCPYRLTFSWTLCGAVIIGDEELLVKLSGACHRCEALTGCKPHYLVRCNLKSGACNVQRIMADQSSLKYSIFSYAETLISPE